MIPCINYILSCVNRGIRCHSLSFVVIRGDSLSIVVFRVSFVAFYRVSFVATPCFNRGQAVVKGLIFSVIMFRLSLSDFVFYI